ncbi:MAG: putative lipoprotein [Leptospira sp.]|nr:putative lipoprotein [Leptospira sp.]
MINQLFISSILLALFTINCSISDSVFRLSDSVSKSSDSVSSISNSVKSISTSFSNSSSSSSDGKEKAALYKNDVRNLASIYSAKILASSGFQEDLGKVAARYGISNWEKFPETYLAIGQGLKKANITKEEFDLIKREISFSNPGSEKLIQSGFDSI